MPFFAAALLIAATGADVRCSRARLESFISEFKSARDAMVAQPSQSYERLNDIDQRLEGCIQTEADRELRFKLVLFSTGIHAYIGAAEAGAGNVSRGKATTDAAVERAKALVRENRSRPNDLKLANELIVQLDRPLRLIREAQKHKSPR